MRRRVLIPFSIILVAVVTFLLIQTVPALAEKRVQSETERIAELNKWIREQGYDWVDFDFSGSDQTLSPGSYWIGLGFTGSPIVNWFFSYGKPVGPLDGTRYKMIFDASWSRSLAYEFNYRISGLAAE